mgnify:CR=1 FL=1
MGDINNLFQQQTPAPIEVTGADALAELVGEGKKYATVEDLAKGAVNAQQHIGTLEQETANLREQTSSAKSIEDVLKAIQGTPQTPVQQPAADQQPAATPGEGTVAEQIAAAFNQRDQQSVAQTQDQNRATLVKDLGATYGADAVNVFNQVGAELGLDLDELAGKSPAAVMKLIASARPAPQQNLSQALPNGQNAPQQQQLQQGGVLNQSAIQALYSSGKIKLAEKHAMENKQLTALGSNAFYK